MIDNISFEKVEEFKYLETTLTKLTEVRECLLSFGAKSFAFQFAIQNLNFKIQRTVVIPKNMVLRRIFGPKCV